LNSQLVESLFRQFDQNEPVELAQQLIRIPSFLWRESKLGGWLFDWLTERGFQVDLQAVPLRDGSTTHQTIGILKGDGTGSSVMLCGHTDTSDWNGDVFRRSDWKHEPFGGDVVDGVLYGLGALNMKGGLAAILVAADLIRRSGRPLKGDLIVACVVAETGGGVGAQHLIASGLRPNYCIVTEAGNLDVGTISAGYVQGKVQVKGEFKHRVPYVNPIEKVTKVIAAFGPSYEPIPAGGWLRYQPHPLLPGFPRMAVRNVEHFQDTTTLTFDLRIIPGMTEASVREDIRRLLDGIAATDPDFNAELVIPQSPQQPNMPARDATPVDSPVVQSVIDAHRAIARVEPVVGAGHRVGATADTCHFKGVGITCVEYGPGFIPIWPMVDECIETAQIVTATKVLALAAAELCG
jgi:acetylornithine deacetylase